jgi:hypothetical protein
MACIDFLYDEMFGSSYNTSSYWTDMDQTQIRPSTYVYMQ